MCLLSDNSGFTYNEMVAMPLHVLLGLWNAKRKIAEEAKKTQSEGEGQTMDPLSLMNQAKGMMPQMPNMPNLGNFSFPNMGSFKV